MEREEYRMGFKIAAAGVFGLLGALVVVSLMCVVFGWLGVWDSLDVVAALVVWFGLCPLALGIAWLAIRAWLIYKWVVR